MHSFRPLTPVTSPTEPLDLLAIGQLIDDAMQPGQFYVGPDLRLSWIAARAETIRWELFHGRLLEAAQTREQQTFLSWHLFEQNETHPATEPLISVKLDVQARRIHVTRGLLSYVWQAFDSSGGVIESQEAIRWTRELVGTIALDEFADAVSLRDELICVLWQAMVGTSRLPLTSVEAPHPAFVFGQLHYLYQPSAGEATIPSWEELLARGIRPQVAPQETLKVIEFILRILTAEELSRFTNLLAQERGNGADLLAVWRAMFNEVSLSPYTRFVDNALDCIDLLADRSVISPENRIDFLSFLLRQLGRHLTAYDLITFHHRGANYPDALLLDAVFKRYLREIEADPARFSGTEPMARLRRRALRQGCLIRRYYEGHLVPDLPTSPGENARVLPATHPRVPEEQILHTHRRHRRLYAADPLVGSLTSAARAVLAESVADLAHADERAELGLAVFIDRPLGYTKAPAEPDLTPLLAHEAFSASIAIRRWQELRRLLDELGIAYDGAGLQSYFNQGDWPTGLPHAQLAECPRPTVALTDVRKVAADFVIVRSKAKGLTKLLGRFGLIEGLRDRYRLPTSFRLCVQALNDVNEPTLTLFDEPLRQRVELEVDTSQGYERRAGVESPRAGLRVRVVWEDTDDPKVLVRRDVDERFGPV